MRKNLRQADTAETEVPKEVVALLEQVLLDISCGGHLPDAKRLAREIIETYKASIAG